MKQVIRRGLKEIIVDASIHRGHRIAQTHARRRFPVRVERPSHAVRFSLNGIVLRRS